MAEQSANYSSYCYVKDNPMKFVDPDGADNIIYLVVLTGADKYVNIAQTVNTANQFLSNLGLKTQVRLYQCDGQQLLKDIQGGHLDKTDAIAVLGATEGQSVSFVKEYLSDIASSDYFSGFGSDTNPERSEGDGQTGPDGMNNVFLLNAPAISSSTPSKNFDSKGAATGTEKDPVYETAATYLLHAAAHLGGLDSKHSQGVGFTMDGAKMQGNILTGRGYKPGQGYAIGLGQYMKGAKHFRDFFSDSKYSVKYNAPNIGKLQSKFGNNPPVQKM